MAPSAKKVSSLYSGIEELVNGTNSISLYTFSTYRNCCRTSCVYYYEAVVYSKGAFIPV
uniref:Uncharacterized protein n=1 Tax=Amphimedon queenslandica TaxID=400682 RepID=A0A1X7UPT0_AMPQE